MAELTPVFEAVDVITKEASAISDLAEPETRQTIAAGRDEAVRIREDAARRAERERAVIAASSERELQAELARIAGEAELEVARIGEVAAARRVVLAAKAIDRAAERIVRPSWVAASVRARLIAAHGLGRERALEISRRPSLDAGIAALASSAYGEAVRPGANLADAQHAVATTALWQLRVLAGWLPPGAAQSARASLPPGSRSPTSTNGSPSSLACRAVRSSISARSEAPRAGSPRRGRRAMLRAALRGLGVGRSRERRARRDRPCRAAGLGTAGARRAAGSRHLGAGLGRAHARARPCDGRRAAGRQLPPPGARARGRRRAAT